MIIDKLSNSHLYYNIGDRITTALKYLYETDFNKLETGRHDIDGDNIYALVNDYDTKPRHDAKLESHKKYIDVQYVASGTEYLGYKTMGIDEPSKKYDEEKDFMLFDEEPSYFELKQGTFAVLFPEDLHLPGITLEEPSKVRKVVIKVKI